MGNHVLGCTMLCLSLLTLSALAISSAHALPANSMWIEPPILNIRYLRAGTKLYITIWLNMITPTNSWQFYLVYDKTYLQALRCKYTGNGQSQWSGGQPVATVRPGFGSHNSTYGYVVQGEVLRNRVVRTGVGSLSLVEFTLTRDADPLTIGQLKLDTSGLTKSCALDKDVKPISLTFGSVSIVPEFPLPSLLIAFSVVTPCIAIGFGRLGKRAHV
jgi:hypothetical protein